MNTMRIIDFDGGIVKLLVADTQLEFRETDSFCFKITRLDAFLNYT